MKFHFSHSVRQLLWDSPLGDQRIEMSRTFDGAFSETLMAFQGLAFFTGPVCAGIRDALSRANFDQ